MRKSIFGFERRKSPQTIENTRKNPVTVEVTGFLIWQREKDSNPHIRSQSPLCYLYTIPLCSSFSVANRYYYSEKSEFVNSYLEKIIKNFSKYFWIGKYVVFLENSGKIVRNHRY